MREILFRGKTENGGWIHGSLIKTGYYCCILEDDDGTGNDYPHLDELTGFIDGYATPVYPDTVGQFTGLTDKNCKNVFEGDILKFTDVKYDYEWIGRVDFGNPNEEYNWGFQLVYIKGEKPNTDILCWFDMEESGAFAEVIGNIHDNPELLQNQQNFY